MGNSSNKRVRLNPINSDYIGQGDILTNVSYTYEVNITNDKVDVIQFEFPFVLVLSQSCDLEHGNRLLNKEIKSEAKVMFSAIVVPFFEFDTIRTGKHLHYLSKYKLMDFNINSDFIQKDEISVIRNGMHYRYHLLQMATDENKYPDYIIDFKTFFTLNLNELQKMKPRRIGRLGDIETQQIVGKFANFLSRVGISDEKMIQDE